MRKIFSLLSAIFILATTSVLAQEKAQADSLPYQKYKTIPAFKILMLDSSTIFNTYNVPKNKPTVLIYFSPDCDHCQMMTDSLLAHMDAMKQASFYFLTPMALPLIQAFYDKNHMDKYKNIVVAKDYDVFFPGYYGVSFVPFVAVYDRKKKLVKSFPDGAKPEELIELLK